MAEKNNQLEKIVTTDLIVYITTTDASDPFAQP